MPIFPHQGRCIEGRMRRRRVRLSLCVPNRQPPTANRQYPFFRSQVSALRYLVQVFRFRYRFRPAPVPAPAPDSPYLAPDGRDPRPGNVSLSLTFAPLHAASPQLHLCTAFVRPYRSAAINSHPFRYSFVSNASASGLPGNFIFTASHSSFTPENLEATLPSCTASVSGPA